MKCLITAILLLSCTLLAVGQTPKQQPASGKPRERQVAVTLSDGSNVQGALVSLKDDVLTVKNLIGTINIELDKVMRIEFSEYKSAPSAKPSPDVLAAIKEIRDLSIAGENGLSFMEYKSRYANLGAKIETVLKTLNDGNLKTAIKQGWSDHQVAKLSWDLIISAKAKGLSGKVVDDVVATIRSSWIKAKEHADEAERSLQ